LDRWLNTTAKTREPLRPGQPPYILQEAERFADEVRRVADQGHGYLSDRLMVQMSDLEVRSRHAAHVPPDLPGLGGPGGVDLFRARLLVTAARDFAEVYRDERGEWPWYLTPDRGSEPPNI
jgi:hypothetical protein